MVYEYEWDIISIHGYIKINGIYTYIYTSIIYPDLCSHIPWKSPSWSGISMDSPGPIGGFLG